MAITAVNTKRMLFNLIFNVAKYYHLAKTQRIAGVAGYPKKGKGDFKNTAASYPNVDMDLHAYVRPRVNFFHMP